MSQPLAYSACGFIYTHYTIAGISFPSEAVTLGQHKSYTFEWWCPDLGHSLRYRWSYNLFEVFSLSIGANIHSACHLPRTSNLLISPLNISTCCSTSTFIVSVPSPSCSENKDSKKFNCIFKAPTDSLLTTWMKPSERTKTNLFQKVLSEASNNAVKHARANAFSSLQVCHKTRAQCLVRKLDHWQWQRWKLKWLSKKLERVGL